MASSDESSTASLAGSLPCSSLSRMGLPTVSGPLVDQVLRCWMAGGSLAAKPEEKRRACRRTGVMRKSETNWAIAKH